MIPKRIIEVSVHERSNGERPYEDWYLNGADRHARSKVLVAIEKLANGNTGNLKSVGGGVYEMKIPFGPGYRVYLGWEDQDKHAILLYGGTKARQNNDIEKAKSLWAEYRAEKKKRK